MPCAWSSLHAFMIVNPSRLHRHLQHIQRLSCFFLESMHAFAGSRRRVNDKAFLPVRWVVSRPFFLLLLLGMQIAWLVVGMLWPAAHGRCSSLVRLVPLSSVRLTCCHYVRGSLGRVSMQCVQGRLASSTPVCKASNTQSQRRMALFLISQQSASSTMRR